MQLQSGVTMDMDRRTFLTGLAASVGLGTAALIVPPRRRIWQVGANLERPQPDYELVDFSWVENGGIPMKPYHHNPSFDPTLLPTKPPKPELTLERLQKQGISVDKALARKLAKNINFGHIISGSKPVDWSKIPLNFYYAIGKPRYEGSMPILPLYAAIVEDHR